MTDPQLPPYVDVRLPGPPERGDPFGVRWVEPGSISPGSVTVMADCIALNEDGSAVVERDGERLEVPAARWSMRGGLTRRRQREVLGAIRAIAAQGAPRVRVAARAIASAVTGDDIGGAADDVVAAATSLNASDDDRMAALLALAVLWLSGSSGGKIRSGIRG